MKLIPLGSSGLIGLVDLLVLLCYTFHRHRSTNWDLKLSTWSALLAYTRYRQMRRTTKIFACYHPLKHFISKGDSKAAVKGIRVPGEVNTAVDITNARRILFWD